MIYTYITTIAILNLVVGYWAGRKQRLADLAAQKSAGDVASDRGEQVSPGRTKRPAGGPDRSADDDSLELELLDQTAELQQLLHAQETFNERLADLDLQLDEPTEPESLRERADQFTAASTQFLGQVGTSLAKLAPAEDDTPFVSRTKIQIRGKIDRNAAAIRSRAEEIDALAKIDDANALRSSLKEAAHDLRLLPAAGA